MSDTAAPPPGALLVALLGGGAAALAGLMWPDFDRWLGLGHRSGLTHSLLLPLLVALFAGRARVGAAIAAGLTVGIAVHCAADLFPHAMRGYALIKLPFVRGLGAGFAYAWLGTTAVAGLVLPLLWIELRHGARVCLVAFAATAMLAATYILLHREPWLSAAAVGGGLALAHPHARRGMVARLRRRGTGARP